MAKMFIKLGLYISIGGIVTFKNARVSKEVVEFLDLDKMLIETDSPYLAPHPHRGKRNEPSYVKLVAEEIAKIKEIPYSKISEKTYNNSMKLFNIKEWKHEKNIVSNYINYYFISIRLYYAKWWVYW